MWFVYIIECSDKTLYTGITTDIERRLEEHNNKKGAAYTRTRIPVKLKYKELCIDRSHALKRESQIKSLTRKDKLQFINSCRNK